MAELIGWPSLDVGCIKPLIMLPHTPPPSNPLVLVLLSGGLDSVAALWWARDQYGPLACKALTLHYGQPNSEQERYAAQVAATRASISCDVCWVSEAVGRGGFITGGGGSYMDGGASAIVPSRNAVLLAIATSKALAYFPHSTYTSLRLVMGCCQADQQAFPDCRPEFLAAQAHALSLGSGVDITIQSPWLNYSKEQILQWVLSHPHKDTVLASVKASWSCYRGRRKSPCGACHACVVRKAAFTAVQVDDESGFPGSHGGDPHRAALLWVHRRGHLGQARFAQ